MHDLNPNPQTSEYVEKVRRSSTYGLNTRESVRTHSSLVGIELSKDADDLEKLKLFEAQTQWAKDEIQRQAASAREAVTDAGGVWDYWVESDMGNIVGMRAEHARRFPGCTNSSVCSHIRF